INKKVSVSVFRNIVMPDAFTPNGDGFNDVFRIPPRTNLALTEFSIFDRNGYRVFTTADISKGWDGTINGIPQNTGWYIYVVMGKNSTGKIISKGSFVLVR
ncbi:MAG: gliding motility-associated C-terminal domain-containing protein, partial [Bacteroidetes bacterium]|nr:gliding motility-associated C-terminal domain-containing protein [Bacteroidota bacterium]